MKLLRAALVVVYPFLIYAGLRHATPRSVALAVLALLALRLLLFDPARLRGYLRAGAWPALAFAAAIGATAIWNDPRALLVAPAAGSAALLVVFGRSLAGESVVERIARVQLGTLGPDEVHYCRRVTALWCGFFALNASIAGFLALYGTLEAWALYTGFLAYLGIGLVFGAEFAYRQWRFRRYVGAPTDFVFRRLFPPRAE
jgi:uncharacterized membrane protein